MNKNNEVRVNKSFDNQTNEDMLITKDSVITHQDSLKAKDQLLGKYILTRTNNPISKLGFCSDLIFYISNKVELLELLKGVDTTSNEYKKDLPRLLFIDDIPLVKKLVELFPLDQLVVSIDDLPGEGWGTILEADIRLNADKILKMNTKDIIDSLKLIMLDKTYVDKEKELTGNIKYMPSEEEGLNLDTDDDGVADE